MSMRVTDDDSSALTHRPVEEGSLPVSARKDFLNAREEQMKLILRCYMENADLVSHMKMCSIDGYRSSSPLSPGESLYDYHVEEIRQIEEDDDDAYGPGYYSMYGTRQSSRRSIIVALMSLSRKLKIAVNAPSLKTVGGAGR